MLSLNLNTIFKESFSMSYIHVKLLNGFRQVLTYSVPDSITDNLVGTVVKVPLKDRVTSAYVCSQVVDLKHNPSFVIKDIHSIEAFPKDPHYRTFLKQLSAYYQVDQIHFIKRIKHFVNQEAEAQLESEILGHAKEQIILTSEQHIIVDNLNPAIGVNIYTPALIHGVTGSGKTEIYKQLIKTAFEKKKTTVLLLPEVSLALRFEQILKSQLPLNYPIYGFHSGTRPKEKKHLWQSLIEGKPLIIIGVHIPMLLPIANLGLIIVDEEHEPGYQEKKHPKVNSKEAALMRAALYQIPIVLGSATPSISSLHNAKIKGWKFFSLQKRFAGAFPAVKVVLLSNKEKRPNFWITKELQAAIADRLAKKEQIIIFLNRRGYSFFVQCKNCSFVFTCTNCSVSLTLHGTDQLHCHYCNNFQLLPNACTSCASEQLLKKGIGTQQVVTILEQLFPTARIGRADMDVTSKKKEWKQTMDDFDFGKIDILVGTQTITKGFHFPNVTLVGILWADLNLHFPVYNAAETTLQQLIQVAGRAGRARTGAQVIIQAMMHHPVFNYVNEIDYLKFYETELASRTAIGYPPALRLVEIELKNNDEKILDHDAMQLAMELIEFARQLNSEIRILGPAKPPVSKIKNTHSRKIYLKSSSMAQLIKVYKKIEHSKFESAIFFTPNPM
ncbi:MAG: hypothetical protein AMXMBFR12_07590 [Candidatus Babeliales bacterium]